MIVTAAPGYLGAVFFDDKTGQNFNKTGCSKHKKSIC